MSETQEQKIHKYIIKSAPYGELTEVLKDLQKISQVNLSSQYILEAIRDYNQDHLALIGDPKQQSIVPMDFCRVQDSAKSQYVSQFKKRKYVVDHLTNQILGTEDYDPDLPEPVVELIKHLESQLASYVKKYYREPNGHAVFVQIDQQKGVIIHLGLTGKNVSLGNFYTGEWLSKWTITTETIRGQASVRAHFFEGGNVQLNEKKRLEQNFQFSADMGESAKKIIKMIDRFEGEMQVELGKVYEEMPGNFFKNLRRIAPVTKTKMSWNINAIKMNQNLMNMSLN